MKIWKSLLGAVAGLLTAACGGGNEPDVPAVGRFHFATPQIESEWKRKQEVTASIDSFWDALAKDAPRLHEVLRSGKDLRTLNEWAEDHIKKIDSRLFYEFGPANDHGCMLTIVEEDQPYLRPILDTLMARQKPVPGWWFATYREALPSDVVRDNFAARYSEAPPPVCDVSCTVAENNTIDVVFHSDKFRSDNDSNDWAKVLSLCQMALGEEDVDRFLGKFLTKRARTVTAPNFVAMSDSLKAKFAEAKKKLQASLPEKPYFELPSPEKHVVAKLSSPQGTGGRLTMMTNFPQLVTGADPSESFWTARWSRHGERMAYLQVEGSDDFLNDQSARDKIIDAVHNALRTTHVGCRVGEGLGVPRTVYVDVMLTNADKAAKELQTIAKELQLPRTSWLRFYDADWRQEWVGMYDDTPAPTDPRLLW